MPLELTPQERDEAMHSMKKFFSAEMEEELSDLRARMLLSYFMKELGPLAYNRGVQDAEGHVRRHLEDLSGACFEHPFTYWEARRKR